jgi:hypothetical protein
MEIHDTFLTSVVLPLEYFNHCDDVTYRTQRSVSTDFTTPTREK